MKFPCRPSQLLLRKLRLLCIVFLMVLLSPDILYAQRYGFFGLIQFTYEANFLEETDGESTKQSSIEQRYNLNYRNYIYHPKLFEYIIGGTFAKEDGKASGEDVSGKNIDYHVRLNFIQGSPFPFSLFASKFTDRTFVPIRRRAPSLAEQETESFGIEGNIYSRKLPAIRYEFREDDRKITGTGLPVDERRRYVLVSLDESFKNTTIDLDYYFVNELDRIEERSSNDHRVDLKVEAILSNTLKLLETAYYYDQKITRDSKEVRSSTRLQYIPSHRFRTYMNTIYNHKEQLGTRVDSFTNSIEALYAIRDYLTASGSTLLSYNTGSFGNNFTLESVTGGLSYFKPIARQTHLSAQTSLSFGAEQREEGDFENRNTIDAKAASMISRAFPSIKTNLSLGGSYYYSRTSLDGKIDRYDAKFRFSNYYIKRLAFKNSVTYINKKSLSDKLEDREQIETIVEELRTDTSINYFYPLGYRGRVVLSSGISTITGTNETTRYYGNITLSYLLRRNLLWRSSVKYTHNTFESEEAEDTIFGDASLNYRIRSVFVNLRYEYRQEKSEVSDSKRQYVFLQVSRPF